MKTMKNTLLEINYNIYLTKRDEGTKERPINLNPQLDIIFENSNIT